MILVSGLVRSGVLLSLLGGITKSLPSDIEEADEEAAKRIADEARNTAFAMGSVQGHVASGIESVGNEVILDGSDQPAILGAEFGGGSRPSTRQFPPWSREGYMVYPHINSDLVEEVYEEALDGLDE